MRARAPASSSSSSPTRACSCSTVARARSISIADTAGVSYVKRFSRRPAPPLARPAKRPPRPESERRLGLGKSGIDPACTSQPARPCVGTSSSSGLRPAGRAANRAGRDPIQAIAARVFRRPRHRLGQTARSSRSARAWSISPRAGRSD
jgi:hypothetical protein